MSKKPQVLLRDETDFDQITMRLDEIVYNFNVKTGTWAMAVLGDGAKNNNIIPNHSVNASKKNIPAINEEDFKPNFLHNREIEDLKQKIEEKKLKIDKIHKKIHESTENQKKLIEEYIRETLEVEKIKEAREKLDKLKKDLGAL